MISVSIGITQLLLFTAGVLVNFVSILTDLVFVSLLGSADALSTLFLESLHIVPEYPWDYVYNPV